MIPLTRDRDEEELQRSARRLFNRIFELIERDDGSFVIIAKKGGKVVGSGWVQKGGREEPPWW